MDNIQVSTRKDGDRWFACLPGIPGFAAYGETEQIAAYRVMAAYQCFGRKPNA